MIVNYWEILKKINVLNYDDGKSFTVTERLDVVCKLLSKSAYRLISCKGLYHLYAKKPLEELGEMLVVLSTHIDCQKNITKCFSEVLDNGLIRGTYDNSITNSAVVTLMLEDRLPDNVVVAFTGDEELKSRGAIALINHLREYHKQFVTVVLDVTGMGWTEAADFTVENDFWKEAFAKAVIKASIETGFHWKFVPLNPQNIPTFLPQDAVIPFKAQPDESWTYGANGVEVFSLCIPVAGNMHCNDGVWARQEGYVRYVDAVEAIVKNI